MTPNSKKLQEYQRYCEYMKAQGFEPMTFLEWAKMDYSLEPIRKAYSKLAN